MKKQVIDGNILFKKLIESSYSGFTLINADLDIIYRSPSASNITGWAGHDQLLNPIKNLAHPDDKAIIADVIQDVLKTPGVPYTCSFRAKHADGHYMWLEATFTNKLNDPDINAIVCNFRDVTQQKNIELDFKKQTEQISGLLETMTDGFIALDENLCYTYVNKQITKLLGRIAESLIGKNVWSVFPDVVGSVTYQGIQTALKEKIYVCNEDFYAPLQLWQENRIYPSAGGISMFIRDISKQKKEEHHLKLLESVITNTNDAILITEAEPFDKPGPRILYVNDAFTKMTGYTAEEVIGKTPRILQGPKTDKIELNRLSKSLRSWQPCELTIINYKKNGEEFWINFALNPVADEKGWYTHWISIDRDVTEAKNAELRKTLLADISLIFNGSAALNQLLYKLLIRLFDYCHFELAELWLTGGDKNKISLATRLNITAKMKRFYQEGGDIKSFAKGEGLPGNTWLSQTIQLWDNVDTRPDFIRNGAAKEIGLKKIYGIPLIADNITIGVLLLGVGGTEKPDNELVQLFEIFSTHFGTEIKRKQLEQELDQIFNFAPDFICVAGFDRYFKKVNPAMCAILEYTEDEILTTPLTDFIHPDDLLKSITAFEKLRENPTFYYENRFITKSGKIKWIGWTTTHNTQENLMFSVGKDITDKKELENLLEKTSTLAQIGGWDLDPVQGTLYWSKITKEIHEVEPGYQPDLETAINFYQNVKDRFHIKRQINKAIKQKIPFDFELPILTAKNNVKWVRVIGEPEFIAGKCMRVYGSFQNVDDRVKADLRAKKALKERNVILESIGDAFFAVDNNWVVTYWNNMAEKVLKRSRHEMLNHRLWDVFSDSIDSISYQKYHTAVKTGKAIHFEDYYPPLNKWYEISTYPSASGLSVYFKDITARKVTEDLLKESEKRYAELFQLSPLPKWVFDTKSLKFLDVNEAAIEHYGYSRKEFLSMTIKDIRPQAEVAELEKTLINNALKKQFISKGIFTHQKKNGSLIQVDIQSNNLTYKGKNARIVIANDVTAHLSYITAIEEQNEKLRNISWMQSHVIRAPLARIMGLIPMVDDVNINDVERKQILEYIKISAVELDEVIGDITAITHIVKI